MKTLVALSLNPTIVGKTYGNFFWFWILPLIACQDIYQGVQMDLSYNLTTTVYYSLALSRSTDLSSNKFSGSVFTEVLLDFVA